MKRILSLIGFLWMAALGFAALRTTADALRIATEFTATDYLGLHKMPKSTSIALTIADSTATYIAVNTADGFILVGADDRLPQVLGYSDSGIFEPANMSPSMRFWLQCYEEELAQIANIQSSASNAVSITAVEPLMKSTWNQSAPYNNYAPAYNDAGAKSATGCVATAMAQVMYYYKQPAQGTGAHSYMWIATDPVGKSGILSADFGSTTYDWANMKDSYKSGYTQAQAEAVATLMYHCGVSIDMTYGSSSGAYTHKVPESLNTYFGYDANYQRIQKVMYPADSLNAIVAAELKAQRPVIVSGSNEEGGHAFVCDGCDKKGYFHINWGWGGSNDGYYLLTALNPGTSQGIGGTSKGYNKGTAFFIGLQPAQTQTPKAIPQMATTNISVSTQSVNRGASFTVSILRLQNYGMTNFKGSYGIALYDEDETHLVRVLKQVDDYSLSAGYYRTTAADVAVSIPSSTTTVPNGTYHLCAVYKDANYGWMRLLCTEDDYYRTVEISSTKAIFYDNNAEPELALTEPISFAEGVNTDSVPFSGVPLLFSVANTGGTFRGEISARIYKGNFSKGEYEIVDDVVIRRNNIFSSALQQIFDANLTVDTQYKMRLCWRKDANDSWHNFEPAAYAELPFKLYRGPSLELTDTIRFDNNDSVPRENANLYYSIRNRGGDFEGDIQLFFYKNAVLDGEGELRHVKIVANETLEGVFSGKLEQQPGIYTVILKYRISEDEWQEFEDIYGNNIGAIVATIVGDTPTAVEPFALPHQPSGVLLMRMGKYDLYLIKTSEGNYNKVFVPVQ